MKHNQVKSVKKKIREWKLGTEVHCQGALKQTMLKQVGVKQELGVYNRVEMLFYHIHPESLIVTKPTTRVNKKILLEFCQTYFICFSGQRILFPYTALTNSSL